MKANRRFVLLLVASCWSLHAATVTTTTRCLVGGVSVGCPANTADGGTLTGTATHMINGLGTTSLLVSGQAESTVGYLTIAPPGAPALEGEASVEVSLWVVAEGSVRPGFLTYDIFGDGDLSVGGAWSASGEIAGVDSVACMSVGPACQAMGDLPVMLGVPIQIRLAAQALALPTTDEGIFGGIAETIISLSFFEVSGASVNVNEAVVPEPRSVGPLGLLILAAVHVIRSRHMPRT